MYVYIYICCEVIIWSKFGPIRVYYLVQVGVIICSKFLFSLFFVVSSGFLAQSIIILCVFCAQLSGNFLKIAFFKKGCHIFSVLSLSFENYLLCLLKHYKIWGFSIFMLLVVAREENRQKNDNWNFWIWAFFVQKWPFRDADLFFENWFAQPPYVYSVFGVRAFWAKLSKKEFFDPPQKRKFLTDNWKAHFLVFFGFCCFLFLFSFACFFVFFGGFKGQFRWPERPVGPPHLALNPPYLFCFFCFLEGQVTWPKGHLTWP